MSTAELIVATLASVVAITIGMGTLVGVLIRFMLVPFLAEKFVLLEETHKQVSENSHKNQTPTVLDRIEEVKTQSDRIERLAVDNHREILAMGRMFDGHLEWSDEESSKLQADVDRIWKRLGTERRHEHGPSD